MLEEGIFEGKEKLNARYERLIVELDHRHGGVSQGMIRFLRKSPEEREQEIESVATFVLSDYEPPDNPDKVDNELRGVVHALEKMMPPYGNPDENIDLDKIGLPVDSLEGSLHPDPVSSFAALLQQMRPRMEEFKRLHADLIILDQVIGYVNTNGEAPPRTLRSEDDEGPAASTKKVATKKQRQYLRIVWDLLQKHPDSFEKGKKACREEFERSKEDGPKWDTVVKQVQTLGRRVISMKRSGDIDPDDLPKLPTHYSGHQNGGFKRLVQDLWNGAIRV